MTIGREQPHDDGQTKKEQQKENNNDLMSSSPDLPLLSWFPCGAPRLRRGLAIRIRNYPIRRLLPGAIPHALELLAEKSVSTPTVSVRP